MNSQIFPSTMVSVIADYKKMASEYASSSDETIRASYKVILDKKIADLRVMLLAYTSSASSAIDALVVA
jgi:hypothetical protein